MKELSIKEMKKLEQVLTSPEVKLSKDDYETMALIAKNTLNIKEALEEDKIKNIEDIQDFMSIKVTDFNKNK